MPKVAVAPSSISMGQEQQWREAWVRYCEFKLSSENLVGRPYRPYPDGSPPPISEERENTRAATYRKKYGIDPALLPSISAIMQAWEKVLAELEVAGQFAEKGVVLHLYIHEGMDYALQFCDHKSELVRSIAERGGELWISYEGAIEELDELCMEDENGVFECRVFAHPPAVEAAGVGGTYEMLRGKRIPPEHAAVTALEATRKKETKSISI